MKKTKALLDKLAEEIEKAPVVQVACDKFGISRNTFYRWMKEDKEFLARINEAVALGTGLVSDVAISNVLSGIKSKDPMYTKYWLSHKHPDFRRPFVHRIEADDLLAHFRAINEGLRQNRIQDEIESITTRERGKLSEETKDRVRDFMNKWHDNIDKAEHERALKLFEAWKKDYESKKITPSRKPPSRRK